MRVVLLLPFLLSPVFIYFTKIPVVVSSFTTQHLVPQYKRYKTDRFRGPRTTTIRLRAVIDPPRVPTWDHMDDKRKKRKDNSDGTDGTTGNDREEDEWTHVNGGFLPKFLQRRLRQQERKTTAAVTSMTTNVPTTTDTPSRRSTTDQRKHRGHLTIIPDVISIDNIADYKSIVVDEQESIVVVRYFASWCRSCRASEPLFRNIVSRYASQEGNDGGGGGGYRCAVKFVQLQLTKDTAYLQEGLGVPSVPYVHVYHPEGGLVEERKFSKSHMAEFSKVLESYVVGSCDLPMDEEVDETERTVEGELEEREDNGDVFGVFE